MCVWGLSASSWRRGHGSHGLYVCGAMNWRPGCVAVSLRNCSPLCGCAGEYTKCVNKLPANLAGERGKRSGSQAWERTWLWGQILEGSEGWQVSCWRVCRCEATTGEMVSVCASLGSMCWALQLAEQIWSCGNLTSTGFLDPASSKICHPDLWSPQFLSISPSLCLWWLAFNHRRWCKPLRERPSFWIHILSYWKKGNKFYVYNFCFVLLTTGTSWSLSMLWIYGWELVSPTIQALERECRT